MEKRSQLGPVAWVGIIIIAMVVVGIIAHFKRTVPVEQPLVQPVVNTAPVDTAGTGTLDNAFNQLSDATNKITVSIYNDTPGQTQAQFLGSGIIIASQNVLTNAHIVNNANNLFVYIFAPQPASYPVILARSDPVNDLALLKITNNARFSSAALIGNSDRAVVGETVFTMGNAFGNGNMLTQGLLLDKNFAYNVNGQVRTNMRTNIGISPGTCGGPLINTRGQIIGINNSIGNPENNYIATPINKALTLIDNNFQNQLALTPNAQNV